MAASALIVGAGSGISAAVARRLARGGYSVALAAPRPETLVDLAEDLGAFRGGLRCGRPRGRRPPVHRAAWALAAA